MDLKTQLDALARNLPQILNLGYLLMKISLLANLILGLFCVLLLAGCFHQMVWDPNLQGTGGWKGRPGAFPHENLELEDYDMPDSLRRANLPEYREWQAPYFKMIAVFNNGEPVTSSDPNSVAGTSWKGRLGGQHIRSTNAECAKDIDLQFLYDPLPHYELVQRACEGDELWKWRVYGLAQRGQMVRGFGFFENDMGWNMGRTFTIILTREGNRMHGTLFEIWGNPEVWDDFQTSTIMLELVLVSVEGG